MRIAIDYDKTFTNDRALFSSFIQSAVKQGHEIKFVTARHESKANNDIKNDAILLGIDIIFTDGRKKQPIVEMLCWNPDVWIDDNPSAIVGERKPSSFGLL